MKPSAEKPRISRSVSASRPTIKDESASLGRSPRVSKDQNAVKRGPSKTSRSMKSRLSEPRTSSNPSKRRSKKRQPVKPPLALMTLAAVIVCAGLILLPRAFQPGQQVTEIHYGPSARRIAPPTIASTEGSKPAMNLTPAAQIRMAQIAGFKSGTPPIIEFRDGSKLNVDPVTLDQLPSSVRLQLTYTREQQ